MPMKIEAVTVVQRGTATEFNSESININKKLLPRDVIANGYKGAGVVEGKSFFALASSSVESCADAAVATLNDRRNEFLSDTGNANEALVQYFKDVTNAIGEMGNPSDAFSCAVFCADKDNAVLAKTGSVKAFAYSDGKLDAFDEDLISHEDGASEYGVWNVEDIKAGDIFFLLTENLAATITPEQLEYICVQADSNAKSVISGVFSRISREENASAFVMKVLETEAQNTTANLADMDSLAGVNAVVSDEKQTEISEKKQKTNKTASVFSKVAVFALCAAMMVVLFVVGVFAGRYIQKNFIAANDDVTVVETTDETTTEVRTTEAETGTDTTNTTDTTDVTGETAET